MRQVPPSDNYQDFIVKERNDSFRCTFKEPKASHTCGKTFKQKSNIIQHVRHHLNFKPYECRTCHKRFVSSSNMHDHERRHENTRPFSCLVCARSFYRNSDLRSHKCANNQITQRPQNIRQDLMQPPVQSLPPCQIFTGMVEQRIKELSHASNQTEASEHRPPLENHDLEIVARFLCIF